MTRVLLTLALVGAVLVALPGRATTVERLTPAQVAGRSDLVARVVVRGHQASWVGRRILTFYDVEIVEAWSTRDLVAPTSVRVALPGGVVGDIGQRVAGVPALVEGQSYVLCLSDDTGPSGARGIIGFWLGAWLVDPAGGLQAMTEQGLSAKAPVTPSALRASLLGASLLGAPLPELR